MKFYSTFLMILFTSLALSCSSDKKNDHRVSTPSMIYIANWNVENLFDTIDDIDKNDEWFTPKSQIKWTDDKLKSKLKNLAKVIQGMNGGDGPDILGIQEVEHRSLLEKLIEQESIKKNYKIVHYESLDKRGIDNALLYNSELFTLDHSEPLKINLAGDKTTRDIVYAVLNHGVEEIHIFVNHWPSRREGLKETEKRRIMAAETLIKRVEKISNKNSANIIILGDFNDLPSNISISKILGAEKISCDIKDSGVFKLFNLTYNKFQKGEGTYKYRDHWNMLDQIIISNSLLDKINLDFLCNSFEIYKPNYILQKEGKYKGTSLPTFGGRKYLGGYSDHFAIGAKFQLIVR